MQILLVHSESDVTDRHFEHGMMLPGVQGDAAAARTELARVRQQVCQDLLHALGVDVGSWQLGLDVELDGMLRVAAGNLGGVVQKLV